MPVPERNDRRFGYKDYVTWPDEERWEIMDGVAYDMSPAPNVKHQRIVSKLDRALGDNVEQKGCTLFVAPTDVVFDEYNVVQPDVFVVCDRAKITNANIQGAPDLVVEVISPSTARKDRREKKRLYETFGVREYILIDPEGQYAERFLLEKEGRFDRGEVFGPQQVLPLQSLDALELPLWEVFEVARDE